MKKLFGCCFWVLCMQVLQSQALYEIPANVETRLSSFENPGAVKGGGGKTNKTAKGNAFEMIQPGQTKPLLDINGEGTVTRIWMTVNISPVMLRSLRLQMFWEGESKPAVDVPMGDFFLHNLGKTVPFQTALFTSGEGRSFNCYVPMPFRKHARIVLINEGREAAKLFYDVTVLMQKLPVSFTYFHAYWSRHYSGKVGDDIEVLPKVSGKGRFLGMSVGLLTDSVYDKTWWGEGEVKMFMDADSTYPSYVGTGAEDYIGSAWGLGTFNHWYQGCTVASEASREFEFYRFHIPDPVYFKKDLRVTLQQIGGGDYKLIRELVKNRVNLKPVTVDGKVFSRLLEMNPSPAIADSTFPEGWVNFFRLDDYAVTSYFYLDKPVSRLPALPSLQTRLLKVK
ncbi:MAG: glycoside hydrolase family 172 protein [Bacteroidota bacterium]